MAEIMNNIPQTLEDSSAEELLISPEAEQALEPAASPDQIDPPATKQNQQQTQAMLDLFPADRMQNLMTANGMTEVQAKSHILDEVRRKQLIAKEQEAEDAKFIKQDAKDMQQSLENQRQMIIERIGTAKQNGIAVPELDQQLSQIDAQLQEVSTDLQAVGGNDQLVAPSADPLQDPQQNLSRIQAEDQVVLDDKTHIIKNNIIDQMAQVQAEQDAIELQKAKLFENQQQIFNDAEELKKDAAKNYVNEVWNETSTGAKIMAALAVGLGAANASLQGSSTNQGLELVMKIVDDQAKGKQQVFERQLALKSSLISKVKGQLQILDSRSLSKDKKMSILQMQQKLDQENAKVQQALLQQMTKNSLMSKAKSRSISPEEQQSLENLLSEDDRKRVVRLPNGLIQLADSEKAAAKVRESQAESEPAIQGLEEVVQLAESMNKYNLLSPERAALETKLSLIAGKLRLPITGPGAMTENEYKRLRESIGDPKKILSLPTRELAKVKTVQKWLQDDLNMKYKQSGIAPIKSESLRERQIAKLMEKGLSREKAVQVLSRLK